MRVKEDGQNAPQGRKFFRTAWDTAGNTSWLDCFGQTGKGDEMQTNTAIAGTADALSAAAALQYAPASQKYTDEQVRQVEAALENPFDPSEIR